MLVSIAYLLLPGREGCVTQIQPLDSFRSAAAVSSRSAVFLAVCYDDSSARHIPGLHRKAYANSERCRSRSTRRRRVMP